MDKKHLLQCENLSIGYHQKSLLDNINWQFEAGKLYSIKGLNGAGKSTFMKTIAALTPPLQGKILLDNQLLHTYESQSLAQKLAYLGSQQQLSFPMSVQEFIMTGRYPYMNWLAKETEQDKSMVKQTIEALSIAKLQNKSIQALSDGEFQQVRIAAAVVREASFIILDEPTSFLDYKNKEKLWNMLKALSRDNKCIIIASHDMDYVERMSDVIYEMNPE